MNATARTSLRRWSSGWMLALLVSAAGLLAGCDDDGLDHNPPPGMGCIIVRNNAADDMDVFINGSSTNWVGAGSNRAYDLRPGIYRIVLDQQDGDRNYRADVDVLVDRRTIMDVTADPLRFDRYDVYLYFD
ncbi:MAG: hypothetical protein V2A34_05620 [Lentisphaerota bacterium]